MPLITPRTTRTKVVRHITQLYLENNEELYAYAQFIGEPTAYVLNALIEKLSSDKDYREWRAKNSGSFVPAVGAAKRRNTASYQARTSAGRAGMVTLPHGV
jgi:hypothetical protein